MATQLQLRRGTTAEHAAFTGAVGEITVNTTINAIVLHDGATAGGHPQIMDSGTKMYFYQNVAPSGWTIDATPADALLAVKGGSQAYNVNGGNQAGTWTQPNCTLDATMIPAHDHGSSAAAHTHTWPAGSNASGGAKTGYGAISAILATDWGTVANVPTATASGTHTHTSVGGGLAHNHGTTYRPSAQVGIICEKD